MNGKSQEVQKQLIHVFTQVERFLLRMLTLMFLFLIVSQIFILSDDENQRIANKAVLYEGVFREDPVEAKATLKRE